MSRRGWRTTRTDIVAYSLVHTHHLNVKEPPKLSVPELHHISIHRRSANKEIQGVMVITRSLQIIVIVVRCRWRGLLMHFMETVLIPPQRGHFCLG